MTIEKAYLVTLKGELANAYYRAGYTDEDIAKFWNEEIAKQIAEAAQIKLQVPSALKVEAKPVKRGKWEEHHATYIKQLDAWFVQAKCSCCGRYSDKMDNYSQYLDLECCSHCGADMRGEDDE